MKTIRIGFRICLWSVLGLAILSCTNHPSSADGTKSEQAIPSETLDATDANIATVQKFIDAQMVGDGPTMRKFANDDFMARNPAGDTLHLDQYIARWAQLNELRSNQDAGVFATNSQEVITGPLKGSWVLFWGTYTAIDSKNQEAMEVLWHADFLLENGKISRSVSYFDMADPEESV